MINRRDFLSYLGVGAVMSFLPGGCRKRGDKTKELFKRANPSNLKILVVGIDGATFDIIEPMVKDGKLEQFKRLMESGTYSKLSSQKPMLSPAIWTTIATGQNRDKHNIVNFFSRKKRQNSSLVSSNDRQTVALWNIASAFRKTVGVDGWWVTWPAEVVTGNMISDRTAHSRWGIWTNTQTNQHLTFPKGLYKQIESLIVDPTNPPMEEIEKLVELSNAERKEMLDAKKPIFAHGLSVSKFGYCAQRTYEEIALYMLEKGQPDLNMIFLIAVDPICHTFWHYFKPEQFSGDIAPEKASRLGKFIPSIYEHNNQYLSKLLKKIDSNTVIIIVSDHGFQSSGRLPGEISTIDYRRFGTDKIEKLDRPVTVGMSGIHQINGVFIASGGPIMRGAKCIIQPSITDITPTILALMGLPVARDMAGRVLEEIIEPKFLSERPVQYIDSYEKYIDRGKLDLDIKAGENEQLEYLKSIGYVK